MKPPRPTKSICLKPSAPMLNEFLELLVGGELLHQLFNFLGLASVRDECGVVGLHDNRITEADDGDGGAGFLARVVDDVASSVDMDEIGDGGVAGGVLLKVAAERSPGPDVIPIEGAIGDDDVLGVLHQ